MNELKERLEIEKQGWIENYMKKQVQTPTTYSRFICPFRRQYSNMAPRFSGQTSISGVVFFVFFWELREIRNLNNLQF